MGKTKETKLLSAILAFSFLLITGVATSALGMDVTLAWDANSETNLAGYKVYYGTTSSGPYNGTGSSDGASPIIVPLSALPDPASPEFTVHGLPDGTCYFVATAFNTEGEDSGYSNEVSAEATAPPPPPPPANPVVDDSSPVVEGFPSINYADSTLTITYSESNMINASVAGNYSLDNGLLLDGDGTDISGTDKAFLFNLVPGTFQRDTIYTMEISSAVTDSAGNPVIAGAVKINDDDNDGWSNYDEYIRGTSANDANSFPQPMPEIEVVEVIPVDNAGIPPNMERIPTNTAFALRMESVTGFDMSDPDAVTFSVNDGSNVYTRKLGDLNGTGKKILRTIPLDAEGDIVYSMWVVYYRSNETEFGNSFPYDTIIEVTANAKAGDGESMDPLAFRFKTEAQGNEATDDFPTLSIKTNGEAASTTVSIENGVMQGASITYDSTLLQEIGLEPYFGPMEEVPPLNVGQAVGAPLNLLPPAVFPDGVTITIPCPGYSDVSTLSIYYFDGEKWSLACDNDVTSHGEGWMVPGSRVNHNENNGNSGWIEIQVYHFSAVVAGEISTSGGSVEGAGGGGGGCFISTLGGK